MKRNFRREDNDDLHYDVDKQEVKIDEFLHFFFFFFLTRRLQLISLDRPIGTFTS